MGPGENPEQRLRPVGSPPPSDRVQRAQNPPEVARGRLRPPFAAALDSADHRAARSAFQRLPPVARRSRRNGRPTSRSSYAVSSHANASSVSPRAAQTAARLRPGTYSRCARTRSSSRSRRASSGRPASAVASRERCDHAGRAMRERHSGAQVCQRVLIMRSVGWAPPSAQCAIPKCGSRSMAGRERFRSASRPGSVETKRCTDWSSAALTNSACCDRKALCRHGCRSI